MEVINETNDDEFEIDGQEDISKIMNCIKWITFKKKSILSDVENGYLLRFIDKMKKNRPLIFTKF